MGDSRKTLECDLCGQITCVCNKKYNKPCPYNSTVMCVQMPCSKHDDNYCNDGCPNKNTSEKGVPLEPLVTENKRLRKALNKDRVVNERDDAFGPFI